MSEGQTAPDLKVLDDNYEIQGELRSAEWARTYIAKRRSDGADVIISVAHPHKSGENNALNHYAADTQLLSKLEHQQIPKVLEGRWVGKDEFAVITERNQTDTLGELIARGEKFTPPRTSGILQKVSAILDWARGQGIVHRGVTPETLAFERGTNRILVSFAPTPIPMDGVPDACADARTIAMLVFPMLTGKDYVEGQSLGDVRSDLAKRVIDETDGVLRTRNGSTPPDMGTFLAVVAAADALKAGELEIAQIQAELLEARRAELEQFAAEQRACELRNTELEEKLAAERKEFERKMAEEEAQLASVKADFSQLKTAEEGQIAAERAQLEQERLDFEARVAEMEARRAEIEGKHAELDRLRAEEGQRIDAAIAAAVETVAATAVPVVAESDDRDAPWRSSAPEVVRKPWVDETVKKHSVGKGAHAVAIDAANKTGRPRWMIAAIIVGTLAVLGVGGVAVARRNAPVASTVSVGGTKVIPTPPTTDVRNVPKAGFMTQSAGGAVAQPIGPPLAAPGSATPGSTPPATAPATSGAAPTAVNPADSARVAAEKRAAVAAAAAAKPKPKPPAERRSAFSAEADAIQRADRARRDSIARRDSLARRDTVVRIDTLVSRDRLR